jgi:hypothetical protein
MCNPILIASAALTAGSTVANANAVRQENRARDEALTAERIRQGGFDRETQALNTQSQERYQDFGAQREAKATALGDYFAPPPAPTEANAMAGTAMPSSTNSIVTQEMEKKSNEARAFTDQQGQALAELRAFGDLLGDTSRLQARDAGQIGQISGFKGGSSNILPLELNAAAEKGRKSRLIGDILGGLGGIGMTAGITGGGALSGLFGGAAGAAGTAGAAARALPSLAAQRPRARPQTAVSLYPQGVGVY